MRDRKKAFVHHSTNELIFIKGDVKTKSLKMKIILEEKGKLQQKYLLHKNN